VTGINKSGSFVINNNKAAAAGNALCKYFWAYLHLLSVNVDNTCSCSLERDHGDFCQSYQKHRLPTPTNQLTRPPTA
jgi:hypothetical protein